MISLLKILKIIKSSKKSFVLRCEALKLDLVFIIINIKCLLVIIWQW